MAYRSDYTGRVAPPHITESLAQRGGYNMFGEPNFRVVWAPDRVEPSGGLWVDWPAGLSTAEKYRSAPIRRVAEVRMVKRYGPLTEWALERWVSAKAYGAREQWYMPSECGGTLIRIHKDFTYLASQGEYPSRGDFEYCGFAYTNEQLSELVVLAACGRLLRGHEALIHDPHSRMLQNTYLLQQAEEMVESKWESIAYQHLTGLQPAFKGVSMSGAGPKHAHSSQAIAERLGIRSHGIS